MTEVLKPCPFCGGPAQEPDNDAKAGQNPRWSISCYQFCVSIHRGTKKETIAAWNTRATQQ
jgi:Lar family restriction alleviation protein